jgi:hypothetical protein
MYSIQEAQKINFFSWQSGMVSAPQQQNLSMGMLQSSNGINFMLPT